MSPTATTPTVSIGGISLDSYDSYGSYGSYDGYMPAWSPTLSEIADSNRALPIVDNQVEEARAEASELSMEQLRRQIKALEGEIKDMRDALNDIENWKLKFSDWGESLMNLLLGDSGMEQRASEVTVLQGRIEESPV